MCYTLRLSSPVSERQAVTRALMAFVMLTLAVLALMPALIEEALNLAYHGARAQNASFNITLEREFDPSLAPTELAPQEMTRVFLNLFGNGFYATPSGSGVAPGRTFARH
jgi:signal transduction histidine kinase